jgi:hypothetical protein
VSSKFWRMIVTLVAHYSLLTARLKLRGTVSNFALAFFVKPDDDDISIAGWD